MSEALRAVLDTVRHIGSADDALWLGQFVGQKLGGRPRLHGRKGGFEGYVLSDDLEAARYLIEDLNEDDLKTLREVLDLVYDLLRPKVEGGGGQVELKTMRKHFPEIDFKTGLQALDADGNPVFMAFDYTYCYIRQYAAKGGKDRRQPRLLSIYADHGMGKGGTGGYVARALTDELVTEEEILAAWHEGKEAYGKFIDQCADLVAAEGSMSAGEG